MKNMTLEQIAACTKGKYIGDQSFKTKEIQGVEKDSRLIEKDYLYLPFVGVRADGHDFIPQAFEKGALAVLSEKELEHPTGPYILVSSVAQALKDMAEYYRSTFSCKVIGITGSVGKTSTKEMIASVLEEKFHVLKTEGNYNNEIGMPLTILKIREEHEIAVIEMGISDFEEMHRLAKVARPDICVITNIGTCHLEKLGNRDGVFQAKTEIFDYAKDDCLVVLNGDDDKLNQIQEVHGKKPVFFGIDTKQPVRVLNYQTNGILGTNAKICYFDQEFETVIPIPGLHMLYNAMAAVIIGMHCGMTLNEIDCGIQKMKTIRGRNNIFQWNKMTVIDDCYNANPMSMKASLQVLSQAEGRTVAILGDMFELGKDEAELHREVGEAAAKEQIDVVICVGTLAKNIADGAKKGSGKVLYFPDKDSFEPQMKDFLKSGDTVLIKASHGMKFQSLVDLLKQ